MRWVDDRWGLAVSKCGTALQRMIVAETLVYSMGVTIAEQQAIIWFLAQGPMPDEPMQLAQIGWMIVPFLTAHAQVGQTRETPDSVVGMDVSLFARNGGLLCTNKAGMTTASPAGMTARLTNKNVALELPMQDPSLPWPALTHPRFVHKMVDNRRMRDRQAELLQWMTRILDNHYEPDTTAWTEV